MSKMTIAQSDFIEKNIELEPNMLSEATGLTIDEVIAYQEAYKSLMLSNDIHRNNSFTFVINLDDEGNVRFKTSFSDYDTAKNICRNVGNLFHKLNTGQLKTNIIVYLLRWAEANKTDKLASEILNSWSLYSDEYNAPIVGPHQLFGEPK